MPAPNSIDPLWQCPAAIGLRPNSDSQEADADHNAVRQRTASTCVFVGDIQSVAFHLTEQGLAGYAQETGRGGTIVEGMFQCP